MTTAFRIFLTFFVVAFAWHLGKAAVDIFRAVGGIWLHRIAGLSARESSRVEPAALFHLVSLWRNWSNALGYMPGRTLWRRVASGNEGSNPSKLIPLLKINGQIR